MPGQPRSDLLEVHIAPIDAHRSDGPPIAVGLMIFDRDVLSEYEPREMLFRNVSVCLGFLRRINPRQPHSEWRSIESEHRNRVPIGHTNYATDQLVAP